MMKKPQHLLAIDQGTTSSRAMVFARDGSVLARGQHEFAQHYPRDGWVEHDPEEIWQSTLAACRDALAQAGGAECIAAAGIANQRETTVVWERASGKPVYNAIVWQDRRGAEMCEQLLRDGAGARVQAKTGLLPDAYFSAVKIAWILEHVHAARARAEAGEILFGTVDSFLLWRLCGKHLTDASNASRTMLFDIHRQTWDEELLRMFSIPKAMLPRVQHCADDYGAIAPNIFGREIPLCAVAGDQQAALFGQGCIRAGMAKCTFGSGAFLMMRTARAVQSKHRLLCALALQLQSRADYALEGSIFHAGTVMQWLRNIGVFNDDAEIGALLARAAEQKDGGVCFVPAFTGLGAPHWRADARAAIFGVTRATGKAELVRAAAEAVCLQTRDLLEAMRLDAGGEIATLRVDGGMAVNDWMMQFLADICGVKVERPAVTETTALGAAYLAGLQCGFFSCAEETAAQWKSERVFSPREMPARAQKIAVWEDALARVKWRGS